MSEADLIWYLIGLLTAVGWLNYFYRLGSIKLYQALCLLLAVPFGGISFAVSVFATVAVHWNDVIWRRKPVEAPQTNPTPIKSNGIKSLPQLLQEGTKPR